MNTNFFIYPITFLVVSGCTNLTAYRTISPIENAYLEKVRKDRSLSISEGNTYYSRSLSCIDEMLDTNNPITVNGKKVKLDITAANILDKTGSILKGSGSTALSDMALHALTKMPKYFEVVDTPSDDVNDSRINYSSNNNPFKKGVINGSSGGEVIAFDISTIASIPVGVTHPTATYINGAIVLYDELSELPRDIRSIGLNIDPLTLSHDVSVTTIGMNLRLVNSSTGRITDNGSIYLTNRLVTVRKSADIFKIINDDSRNADYSVVASDPKQYAVMEMMEKGIYTIFSKLLGSPGQCEPGKINMSLDSTGGK